MTDLTKPLAAAVGLGHRLWHEALAVLLPWSGVSQQESWRAGYREGLKDGIREQAKR